MKAQRGMTSTGGMANMTESVGKWNEEKTDLNRSVLITVSNGWTQGH